MRIYRVFEAHVIDPDLCKMMLDNGEKYSGAVLREMAIEDARKGGRGRANGMFVAPRRQIRDAYLSLLPDKRGDPLPFGNGILNGNVPASLDNIGVPAYQAVGN